MGCVCVSFEHNLGDGVSKRSWVSKYAFGYMYFVFVFSSSFIGV